jgi:hypothetical protein
VWFETGPAAPPARRRHPGLTLRSAPASSAARRFFVAHAQASLGTGLALLDRVGAAPESLHGRPFSLQRMCIASAFCVSFVGAGALITAFGVRSTPLLAGIGRALVTFAAHPRRRKARPSPNHAPPTLAPDALA